MKKILLSFITACMFIACSENNDNNNSNQDVIKIKEELNNLVKTSLVPDVLDFQGCREYYTLKNPRNETVQPYSLDTYLHNAEVFSDEYISALDISDLDLYIQPNQSAGMSIYYESYESNNPNAKQTPYSFIAFLTDAEIKEIEKLFPGRPVSFSTATWRSIVVDMLKIVKPYTKVYKYTAKKGLVC